MLNRGRSLGTYLKSEVSREDVLEMMAGGQELEALSAELEEFARPDQAVTSASENRFEAATAAKNA